MNRRNVIIGISAVAGVILILWLVGMPARARAQAVAAGAAPDAGGPTG